MSSTLEYKSGLDIRGNKIGVCIYSIIVVHDSGRETTADSVSIAFFPDFSHFWCGISLVSLPFLYTIIILYALVFLPNWAFCKFEFISKNPGLGSSGLTGSSRWHNPRPKKKGKKRTLTSLGNVKD